MPMICQEHGRLEEKILTLQREMKEIKERIKLITLLLFIVIAEVPVTVVL